MVKQAWKKTSRYIAKVRLNRRWLPVGDLVHYRRGINQRHVLRVVCSDREQGGIWDSARLVLMISKRWNIQVNEMTFLLFFCSTGSDQQTGWTWSRSSWWGFWSTWSSSSPYLTSTSHHPWSMGWVLSVCLYPLRPGAWCWSWPMGWEQTPCLNSTPTAPARCLI